MVHGPFPLGGSGYMPPQKNLKSRNSEMHVKISVVVVVVVFTFFINTISIFINEITAKQAAVDRR